MNLIVHGEHFGVFHSDRECIELCYENIGVFK